MNDGRVVVVGVGNLWRGDDGAGVVVAQRLRASVPAWVEVVERDGEPVALLEAWSGADCAYVVDATRSGSAPGTVVRLEVQSGKIAGARGAGGSHAAGLADAVELARVLGRLPGRLVVYGIEGATFDLGGGLSPGVEVAAADVAARVLGELRVLRG